MNGTSRGSCSMLWRPSLISVAPQVGWRETGARRYHAQAPELELPSPYRSDARKAESEDIRLRMLVRVTNSAGVQAVLRDGGDGTIGNRVESFSAMRMSRTSSKRSFAVFCRPLQLRWSRCAILSHGADRARRIRRPNKFNARGMVLSTYLRIRDTDEHEQLRVSAPSGTSDPHPTIGTVGHRLVPGVACRTRPRLAVMATPQRGDVLRACLACPGSPYSLPTPGVPDTLWRRLDFADRISLRDMSARKQASIGRNE